MKNLLVLSLLCSLLFCGAAFADQAQGKKTAAKKSAAKKAPAKKKAAASEAAPKKAAPEKAEAPAEDADTDAPAPAPAAPAPKAPAAPAAPVPPPPRNIALDFRGGKVLCAEISSKRPAISGFNEKNFQHLPARPLYASVTILCDADRLLSIYDYCLDHYGIFPCIAVGEGNGTPVSSPDKVFRVNPRNKYTLIFILDAAVVGNDIELCGIKALCDNGPFSKQLIPFRNLKDKSFTPPGRVPLSGLIPEKK